MGCMGIWVWAEGTNVLPSIVCHVFAFFRVFRTWLLPSHFPNIPLDVYTFSTSGLVCVVVTLRRNGRRAKELVVNDHYMMIVSWLFTGYGHISMLTGKRKRQRSTKRWQRRAGWRYGTGGRTKEERRVIVWCLTHFPPYPIRTMNQAAWWESSNNYCTFELFFAKYGHPMIRLSMWYEIITSGFERSLCYKQTPFFLFSSVSTSYNFIFSFVVLLIPLFTVQQHLLHYIGFFFHPGTPSHHVSELHQVLQPADLLRQSNWMQDRQLYQVASDHQQVAKEPRPRRHAGEGRYYYQQKYAENSDIDFIRGRTGDMCGIGKKWQLDFFLPWRASQKKS